MWSQKIIAQKNALFVSVQNIFGLGYSPLMRAQTEETPSKVKGNSCVLFDGAVNLVL